MKSDFPHAIMHVDGDSFFVSCEIARRPDLRGRPVVTGLEKGIASAMSPEAKKRGIYRGMRIREMRRVCPDVVILASDYPMYAQYAQRMYRIVRRYTDLVEEYSIDECFADLTDCALSKEYSYEEIARRIQADLHSALGITFSVGLCVNKVMAKIASKWNKPAGLTVIHREEIATYIGTLAVGKLWGIGSSTNIYLKRLGIMTALDLALKDHSWVAEHCDKPVVRIYEELRGNLVIPIEARATTNRSIQSTRTFRPPSGDREFVWSQLSLHVEEACQRLRLDALSASHVSFFAKTQDFEYLGEEVMLPEATAEPQEVLRWVRLRFEALFVSGLQYRATGITLFDLRPLGQRTASLFAESPQQGAVRTVTAMSDLLARKFGSGAVFLGSSLRAARHEARESSRQEVRHQTPTYRGKRFDLIFLGKVS